MPRPPRFFISPGQIAGSNITITGEDARHIGAALRMTPGEKLLLCDGQGSEYISTITSITRSEIVAEILESSRTAILLPRITLCQGLPKSDKMDLIVQKATELGVASIVPLITERTVLKLKDKEKRAARWQKICREAAMQSNRPDIPAIEPVVSLPDYVGTLRAEPGTLLLLPWEEGTEPIKNVLKQNRDVHDIVVLIGPEGGFSRKETDLANGKGIHLVSLGRNILRTETAALAVLSMLAYEYLP